MNIPELFIRRPVTTTLVMMGILIFGIMSYVNLPVSELPNVDFPTIEVTANLPGSSPENRCVVQYLFPQRLNPLSLKSRYALGVSYARVTSINRSIQTL